MIVRPVGSSNLATTDTLLRVVQDPARQLPEHEVVGGVRPAREVTAASGVARRRPDNAWSRFPVSMRALQREPDGAYVISFLVLLIIIVQSRHAVIVHGELKAQSFHFRADVFEHCILSDVNLTKMFLSLLLKSFLLEKILNSFVHTLWF